MRTATSFPVGLPKERTPIYIKAAARLEVCHSCRNKVHPKIIQSACIGNPKGLEICPICHSYFQGAMPTNGNGNGKHADDLDKEG